MLVLGTTISRSYWDFNASDDSKGHNNEWRQDRTTLITTTQRNEIKHFNTNVTFNNIYYKHWSSWYPSGRGKNHSPAAPAGPCHWCWALGGTGKTRGMGEMEGSGAPVAALEWGLGRTHRRGLRGRRGCAGRPGTEVPPGCGSGSVGGCSGTPPGSSVWRRTWLWAAAGPGPDRRRGLWWAKSRWTGPGSSVGPLPGTSPRGTTVDVRHENMQPTVTLVSYWCRIISTSYSQAADI